MKQLLLFTFSMFYINSFALGEQKMTAEQYIDSFKDEAIKEMKRTGVPASITLAQGMLESAYGNSYLARKANNHFGIKCHSDWTGPKVYKDDDAKNECFRKYKHVLESYKDHSDFLKNRSRYAFLFELKPTDYKGWAKGLKKAGYATNPKYPSLLIDLIERNNLSKYDFEASGKKTPKEKEAKSKEQDEEVAVNIPPRILMSPNHVKYIIVKKGDSFENIEQITGVRKKRLLRYNERRSESIAIGEKLYIQPKKRKAKTRYYVVKQGDTLYGIAQEFAVSIKSIVKRNRLNDHENLQIGQQLKLRGKKVKL